MHAQTLGFIHPMSNKKVEFKTNIPLNFKKMVDYLENLVKIKYIYIILMMSKEKRNN